MDRLAVIIVLLHLLFRTNTPQRCLYIPILILAADHKADLTAGVCRDGGVGVFDDWEDLFAECLQFKNDVLVQPDALA